MSANIKYEIVSNGRDLDIGAPSSFIEAMSNAFGNFPVILTVIDLEKLLGMEAAYGANSNPGKAIRKLIRTINDEDGDHHDVKVWADY